MDLSTYTLGMVDFRYFPEEGHQKMKLFVVTPVIKFIFLLCIPKHIQVGVITHTSDLLHCTVAG